MIRILLVELPYLLADILEEHIGNQAGMRVVGRISDSGVLLTNQAAASADAVLFDFAEKKLSKFCDKLLRKYPRLQVFSITKDGRVILECRLKTHVIDHGEASPDRIAELIAKTFSLEASDSAGRRRFDR